MCLQHQTPCINRSLKRLFFYIMYRKESGFGCLLWVVIFAIIIIVGGIKRCVNGVVSGDIKMPKIGSRHVSGGSGSHVTSNGYNVQYSTTTSPNYNGSINDYSHTNDLPTEFRQGSGNSSSSSSYRSSHSGGQSASYSSSSSLSHSGLNSLIENSSSSITTRSLRQPGGSQSSSQNSLLRQQTTGMQSSSSVSSKTCPACNGSGRVIKTVWYTPSSWYSCSCGRNDSHSHTESEMCEICMGKGRLEIKTCPFCGGKGYDVDLNGNRFKCIGCDGKGKKEGW